MAEENEHIDDKTLDKELDDSIRANLREIQSRESGGDDAESLAEPVEASPKEVKPERAREPDGKFAKEENVHEAAKPAPGEPAAEPEVAAEPEAPLISTTGQPLDINRPPASWKPAAKAQWSALPEPIRAEIYRRETDFLKDNKGLREHADFGQSVRNVVAPYQMLIEAEGGTPERAIADTMRTAALFRVGTPQQKLNALFALDKQFNAGLAQFIQEQVGRHAGQIGVTEPQPQTVAQGAQPYSDPRVDQLMASMEQQRRESAAAQERASNNAVEQFVAMKDAQGAPLYPFVDNVLTDMSQRIAIIRGQNPSMDHLKVLEQAYEAAVWANPETRAVLIGQQQAAAQQPADTLRRTEQAKRARAGNVQRRGALPTRAPETVLTLGSAESDESIRETYRQLQANA